jgi:hypothetical protein
MQSSGAGGVLRTVVRFLRIGRVLNAGARWLPPGARLRYDRLKVRAGFGSSLEFVPPDELQRHYQRALALLVDRLGPGAIGDYLEFGVYVGTSMTCMYRALTSLGLDDVRLVGFDSFEGLPAAAKAEGGGRWRPGQFHSDVELTMANLRRRGVPIDRVTLVPGWFEETATEGTANRIGLGHASVVLIDCDLYSSAVTALKFCASRLGPVAVVFFDEWSVGRPGALGLDERRAFEEFLAAHPEFRAEEVGDLGRYKGDSRGYVVTRVDAQASPPGSALTGSVS